MSESASRRTVLKASAIAVAAVALPAAKAKEVPIDEITKGLAKPLTPANLKVAQNALKEVAGTSAARLKHKLPENSEPSLRFEPLPAESRSW